MAESTSIDITAQLAQCRKCREPLVVVNGSVQRPRDGRLVFWVRDEQVMITAHHHLCAAMTNGSPVYRA